MIVQELDVAGLHARLQAEFVRKRRKQVERLVLLLAQARRAVELLRRLDVGARVLAGEAPFVDAEHRVDVIRRLSLGLFVLAAVVVIAEKLVQQIRPALQHCIVDRRRADNTALASLLALPGTKQRHDIAPVGMEPERRRGAVAARVGAAELLAIVAHFGKILPRLVLRDRRAQVCAYPP